MDIIPILSTIILITTIITVIIAVAAYIVFRVKEKQRAIAKGTVLVNNHHKPESKPIAQPAEEKIVVQAKAVDPRQSAKPSDEPLSEAQEVFAEGVGIIPPDADIEVYKVPDSGYRDPNPDKAVWKNEKDDGPW